MEPKVVLFFFSLFLATTAGPLHWQSNQCSRQCSHSQQRVVSFARDKTFEYEFQTKTTLSNQQTLALRARAILTVHSDCDLTLFIRDSRFEGIQDSRELKESLETFPLHFGYDNGIVTDVCVSPRDQQWSQDVKKALLSALQFSARSPTQQTVVERDILGDCETTYTPIENRFSIQWKKSKTLNNCLNREKTSFGFFPRAFPQSLAQGIPLMNSKFECIQTLSRDLIEAVTCHETQALKGFSSSLKVETELTLRLTRQEDGVYAQTMETLSPLSTHLKMSSHFPKSSEMSTIVRSLCQSLESENQIQSSDLFSELVFAFKTIESVEEIQRYSQMCSHQQFQDLILDASALSGSQSGSQLIKQSLSHLSRERQSYLFHLLSFTSDPSSKAAKVLVPLLKSDNVEDHVMFGISSLIHNLKESGKESHETEAIEALKETLERRKAWNRVPVVKALANIGLESNALLRKKLWSFASNREEMTSLRVASIEALAETMTSSEEKKAFFDLFSDESESHEIRIRVYKSLVLSGVDSQTLENIRRVTQESKSRDIQQYVRSHQKNLRETSDPHKRYSLPLKSVQFDEPSNQLLGISRNFENSFMIDALGFGLAFESDLIHSRDSQSVPQVLIFNSTIPAFGKELQFFQLEIRHKNMEKLFHKYFHKNLVFKHFFQDFNQIFSHSRDSQQSLELYVKVDGKTLFAFNSRESQQLPQIFKHFKSILNGNTDRAIGWQPINTRLQLPTVGGLPLELRINASIIGSLKSKIENNWKSVSFEPIINAKVEGALQVSANTHHKSHALVAHVTSAPKWHSSQEWRDGLVSVKVGVPDSQTLFRVKSVLLKRDSNSFEEKNVFQMKNKEKQCFQWISLNFCQEFNERKGFEIFLEKKDSNLKTIDFEVQYPRERQQLGQYRLHFNTPNSREDRELLAEVLIQRNQLKGSLKTPFFRYSLNSRLVLEEKEKQFKLEFESNSNKQLEVEVSLQTQNRGQKREFRPKVRIQLGNTRQPIELMGSISVARGRKNSLQIQLEGNQKQFLKGSFVREGERKSQDLRLSSDLSANIPGIDLRMHLLAEHSPKHSESDLTLEYRIEGKRKESIKVSFKVQNLTQSLLTKVSAFSELTSTQFPFANFHVAYNLLSKPLQQLENEFTLQWNQRLDSRVHILAVSKLTNERIENTLDFELTPIHVNYELRVNADLKHAQSGPLFQTEVIGKDKNGNKNHDLKANFNYKHVSRSPLHLTLSASVKTASRDFSYSDSLVERSRGEYSGDTRVAWSPTENAILKYVYKRKGINHEMDARLESMGKTWTHSGLLRLSSPFRVKSTLNSGESALYSLDSSLEPGSATLDYSSLGYATKALYKNHVNPRIASLEIETPFGLHKSSSQWSRDSLLLRSDTKNARKGNVVSIEAHVSPLSASRVVVSSPSVEAKVLYDFSNPKKSISWDLNSNSNFAQFSHFSHLNYSSRDLNIESKSHSKGKPFLSFDSNLSKTQTNVNLEIPTKKSSFSLSLNKKLNEKNGNFEFNFNELNHKSVYNSRENQRKLQTKTSLERRPLLSIDYSDNGLEHAIHSDLLQNYQLEGVVSNLETQQPFVEINAKSKSHSIESQNRFSRDNNIMKFESKTKRFSKPLNEMKVFLSPKEKNFELISGFPEFQTQLSRKPFQTHFTWNCPQVNHETTLDSNPNFSLNSKTFVKKNQNFLHLNANHALKMSRVSLKSNSFDSELSRDDNSGKFVLESRDYPLSHVTEVKTSPETYVLESRSSRSGNPLYSLNSEINFGKKESKDSRLDFSFGKDFSLETKGNLFHKNFEIKGKNPKLFSHFSSLETNHDSIAFKSRTEDKNGVNLAKIDSFLSPRDKSHVSIVTPHASGQLEVERNGAKFELNSSPFHHKTSVSRDNNEWSLVSRTTKSGEELASLETQVKPWTQVSRVSLSSLNSLKSDFHLNPNEKSLHFSVKTPSYSHETRVSPFELNSRTLDSEERNVARIKAQIRGEKPSLEFEIPTMSGKSDFDFNERKAFFEFKSKIPQKRHLLASIRARDGLHFDLNWDPKDQSSRLALDFSSREESSQYVGVTRVEYSGNELTLTSRMTSRKPLLGPHALLVEYKPKFNSEKDLMKLEVKHEIRDQRMECLLAFSEGILEKFKAKLEAKVANGLTVNLETFSPNPELEMNFSFIEKHENLFERKSAHFFTEVKVSRSYPKKEFLWNLRITRNNREFNGKSRLETPMNGIQEMEIHATEDQLRVNSRDLEVVSNYELKNGLNFSFDLKSRIARIPSLLIQTKVNEKEIQSFVEKNGEKVFEVLLRKSGNSLEKGLEFEAKVSSLWSPRLESRNRVTRDSKKFSFFSQNNYNLKEVSALALEANKLNGIWSGSARIGANGADLAKASLETSLINDKLNYKLNARSDNNWIPIRVEFSFESAREKRLSLKACAREECFDAKVNARDREVLLWVSRLGETVEARVALFSPQKVVKSEENLLSLRNGRLLSRYLSEISVRISGHLIGFDFNEFKREFGFDYWFRLFLPNSRDFELKMSEKSEENSFQLKSVLKNEEKKIFSSNLEISERKALFQISSPKWKREKSVSFEWIPRESFKAVFDLKDEKNSVSFESVFHETSSHENKTLSLGVKTRDGSFDYLIESHLSLKSFGINIQNIRNGKEKVFSIQSHALNRNDWKRVQSFVVLFEKSFVFDFSFDKTIDIKIREEKSGKTYDLSLIRDEKCVKLEFRSHLKQFNDKRIDFCFDFQTKDKIFVLSLEENEKKAFEVKLGLKPNQVLRASLEWNSRELQQLITNNQWIKDEIFEESARELQRVSETLNSIIFSPFFDSLNDIFVEIIKHLKINSRIIENLIQKFSEISLNFWNSFYENFNSIQNSFKDFFQWISRKTRKSCKRFDYCYRALYALDNYSPNDVIQEAVSHSHALVVRSVGHVTQWIPSTPEWFHAIQDYIHETWNWILDSNPALNEVLAHVTVIGDELSRDYSRINWKPIKESLAQIASILFSRSSVSRVVVWDPNNGRLALEIRSPSDERRVQEVLESARKVFI